MSEVGFPLLSLLVFLPMIGVFLIPLLGRSIRGTKSIAIGFHGLVLLLTVYAWLSFNYAQKGFQLLERYNWVPQFGVTYTLGVDGINLPMVVLSSFIFLLTAVYSWGVTTRVKEFHSLMLLLQVGITGVFVALDLLLFFVFWEIVLIPMYFFIAIWGGPMKEYASTKFILYTHVGSLVMLLAFIAFAFEAAPRLGGLTFNLIDISAVSPKFPLLFQVIVFGALLFGFGIKMPLVPFHTWLPTAHVEAPTEGSVILAALLLKMGGYGLIRIPLSTMPLASELYAPFMAFVGIITILYGSFICVAQKDLKRMIAYSSVGHMGMVLLGASTLNTIGISGAVYQMFAHGLVTAILFMMAGSIHHNAGTRMIPLLGGIASRMPTGSFMLAAGSLGGAALPGMALFVSEFTVFLAAFRSFGLIMVLPVLAVAISAGYFLWTLQRAVFGPYNEKLGEIHDIKLHESVPLGALMILLVAFGVAPFLLMDPLETSVVPLVQLLRSM